MPDRNPGSSGCDLSPFLSLILRRLSCSSAERSAILNSCNAATPTVIQPSFIASNQLHPAIKPDFWTHLNYDFCLLLTQDSSCNQSPLMDGESLTLTNHIGTDLANYHTSIYQAWLEIGLLKTLQILTTSRQTQHFLLTCVNGSRNSQNSTTASGSILFLMTRNRCRWLQCAQTRIVDVRSLENIAELLQEGLYIGFKCITAHKDLGKSQQGAALQQLPYSQEAITKHHQICHT